MTANVKLRDLLIPRLAKSLRAFYPECVDKFLCPVCLTHFNVSDIENISVAHILPEAIVSGPTTLLCTRCNKNNGKLQDKWFGEHLHLVLNKKSILGAKTLPGHFRVEGIRLGGKVEQRPDGSIVFQYGSERTSPKSLWEAEELFGVGRGLEHRPSIVRLQVEIPLLTKQNQPPQQNLWGASGSGKAPRV